MRYDRDAVVTVFPQRMRKAAVMPGEETPQRTGLMQGKRGLIMGVANDHSIAWGIAKTLADHGAQLAFTYQGEALGKRVKPLAQSVGSSLVLPCDVENLASVEAVFSGVAEQWHALDFVVHAIAFSDRNELKGRYADTTRENFSRTMLISCFSFTEIAKRAAALMPNGGSMVTLTFGGSTRPGRSRDLHPSDPSARNYMYYRGKVLRFGKLTMMDADLQIVDADPDDPFDFDLAHLNEQLVAGESHNQPDFGLVTVMPDYGDMRRVTSASAEKRRASQ